MLVYASRWIYLDNLVRHRTLPLCLNTFINIAFILTLYCVIAILSIMLLFVDPYAAHDLRSPLLKTCLLFNTHHYATPILSYVIFKRYFIDAFVSAFATLLSTLNAMYFEHLVNITFLLCHQVGLVQTLVANGLDAALLVLLFYEHPRVNRICLFYNIVHALILLFVRIFCCKFDLLFKLYLQNMIFCDILVVLGFVDLYRKIVNIYYFFLSEGFNEYYVFIYFLQ